MNLHTELEGCAACLVGQRLLSVRYDLLSSAEWGICGPGIDVDIESILLDTDAGLPFYLTWSSGCGPMYSLSLKQGVHWADESNGDTRDFFETVAVHKTSGWANVIGSIIEEARIVWNTILSEELPPSAVERTEECVSLDVSRGIPSTVTSVPQELALRFGSGHWVTISAARYDPDSYGLIGCMDKLLVVHDDEFARRYQVGAYAPVVTNTSPE